MTGADPQEIPPEPAAEATNAGAPVLRMLGDGGASCGVEGCAPADDTACLPDQEPEDGS